MVQDFELAKLVSQKLQASYRLLDDAAFDVRQHCPEAEAKVYIEATGLACADIIFKLMEPLYALHPELAPEGWTLQPVELLSKFDQTP